MKIVQSINKLNDSVVSFDTAILLFRIIVSSQLMIVHGLKKIGIGTGVTETVPNPFNFTEWFNDSFAIAANLVFPLFIIVGFYTRLATIPVLAVTLSGYFIVHWNDPLLISDVPFMYSLSFLFIAFSGAGKYSLDNLLRNKS
ncbi:MAG: DoxX family protein [Bacteroidota bacterium]